MIELLSPAGNFEKLKTAIKFGADAVYIGGKSLSLRAQADNFSDEEIEKAVKYVHEKGKKLYVAVNIFPHNSSLERAKEFLPFLEKIGVDAVIVSDVGIMRLIKNVAKNLKIHVSTQANVTNKEAVMFWRDFGAERVVLARELSLKEIKEIHDYVPDIDIECFAHGAMCISYSGRCLLSEYFNKRDANLGDCVQACRWEYEIREVSKNGDYCSLLQDEHGSYILNSKDLNMIYHLKEMIDSGVVSFKVEGRMKSEYYVATVINAYRRAIDDLVKNGENYKNNRLYIDELEKTAHRAFTTAYAFGQNLETVNHENSQSKGTAKFIAVVKGYDENKKSVIVEMRNRFKVGDELEVLSPDDNFLKKLKVDKMTDENGNDVLDAKVVQQTLYIKSPLKLKEGDILRI